MNPYLRFGPGNEPAAWIALAVAFIALLVAWKRPRRPELEGRARFAWLLGLAALGALLSTAYIVHYLRGGPRIVDATYYFLQARALAEGHLSFAVPEPLASFHGRFLVANASRELAVLFPPGYPAALAAAFVLGAPLALGPLLAALLVAATYWLARELDAAVPAALAAAAIGVVSAALRYHTADPMSHGFAALLLTTALASSARGSTYSLAGAGLCTGWLIATRPVTGVVGLLAVAYAARTRGWRAAWIAPFLAPGVGLLLLHQHAATGEWLGSSQLTYYALADGPPGCFRYGFGAGIGCVFEHGDFVRARLPGGYGFVAAAGNTLRRLAVHTTDIANAAPLALLVPCSAWMFRREPRVRLACAVVAGVVLAYAPFYFEGSYPGGGARFFADVLPLEHVLIAKALSRLGWLRWFWPATLSGFALHAGAQHALLRDRDGGRPMFEPAVLRQADVTRGLVFVTTDHGFGLGHDPGVLDATQGVVVARQRNDLLDRLLWNRLGRPPAFQYAFTAGTGGARPELARLNPAEWSHSTRTEAEHLWPVLGIRNGWAHPDFSPLACASGGRGLRVHGRPADGGRALEALSTNPSDRQGSPASQWAWVTLATPSIPESPSGRFGWIGAMPPNLRIVSPKAGPILTWTPHGVGCWRSDVVGFPPEGSPLAVEVRGAGILDYVELSR